MSDVLKLGIEESRRYVPDLSVQTSAHPSGNGGVAISVKRVNEKIAAGRNDLRVRALAGQMLKEAGDPRVPRDQASAILYALRKRTCYVQDPINTEMVHSAAQTLCLDDKGFCLRAGDCDDLVVAYCSLVMSIGIPAKTVIQAFGYRQNFEHICASIYDRDSGDWYHVDPASELPFGESLQATKEQSFDPMSEAVVKIEGGGDYIGVGHVDTIGLGDTSITTDAAQAVADRISAAMMYVRVHADSLAGSIGAVHAMRDRTRGPGNYYDPEPASPILSVIDFPHDGRWTKSMEDVAVSLLNTAGRLLQWGDDALTGLRKIYVDPATGEAKIESKDTDEFWFDTIASTTKDAIIGVYEKGKGLVSGVSAVLGRIYSPTELAQAGSIPASDDIFGLGNAAVIILGIVGTTVAAVAMYYAFGKLCDMCATVASEAVNIEALKLSGGDPAKAKVLLDGVVAARAAQAKAAQEQHGASTDWTEVLKWGAVIAGIGGTAYLAYPVIRSWADRRGERR
jgi:hypothetical protein